MKIKSIKGRMTNNLGTWMTILFMVTIGMISAITQNGSSATLQADLEIGGLTKIPASDILLLSSVGATATFTAKVTNHGPNAVPSFQVFWYIDGEQVDSQTYPALGVNLTTSVSDTLTASIGKHEVRVEVHPPQGYIDPYPYNNIDEGYFWFL